MPMKKNVWEFLGNKDERYAVHHNGKLLSDGISEERREYEFCIRFDICGHEYEEIVPQLRQSGKCRLELVILCKTLESFAEKHPSIS
jgi:hypothetical protein